MKYESDQQATSGQSDVGLAVRDARVFPHWFLQQSQWAANPAHSDSAVYNLPINLRIQGPLDQRSLESSLTEIVRRHEILRSKFFLGDGNLMQRISAFEAMKVEVVDLAGLEGKQKDIRAREIVKEETLKRFDLSSSPILRATLLRLGNEDHVLALTTHHLVVDDWSVGIVARELAALYRAFSASEPSPFPDFTFKYTDFIEWQQNILQGHKLQSRLTFWKKQLENTNDFHHLPTDHPRPAKRTNRGGLESAVLSQELSDAVRTLGKREGVTLFMTLLAAFQVLLHRDSGDTVIGLGSCAANRSLLEVEGIIGRFANDLVLCTDFAGNPTFQELLSRVRRTALEAYSHQDVPFGTLVEEVLPVRNESRNPLFQVMFILQDAPREEFRIPGLTVGWARVDLGTSKYDLTVWLTSKQQIEISFEYNADLFEAQTIKRLMDSYRTVLETIVENPAVRVASFTNLPKHVELIGLTSSEERNQYLSPRNSLEAELVKLWEEAFQVRPIGIRDNFFDLGGESLLATRLCRRIERSLEKQVSIVTFLQAATIEELSLVLSDASSHGQMVKVVPLQPHGRHPPFFCPCINVGAGPGFAPLTRHTDGDQPFLGLVPEETLMSHLPVPYRMEDIARHLVFAIRNRQPTGPYFLGGFCGDGVLAFETARQLQTQGEVVALLVLFEAKTPDRYCEFKGKGTQLRLILQRFALQQLKRHLSNLGQANIQTALGYIRNRASDVICDMKSLLWQTSIDWNLKINQGRLRDARQMLFVAEEAYRPQSYEGDVVLFRCTDYRANSNSDRHCGWHDLVHGSFEVYDIAGDHLGILNEPNVQLLGERLSACLRAAQQKNQTNRHRSSRHGCAPVNVTVGQ